MLAFGLWTALVIALVEGERGDAVPAPAEAEVVPLSPVEGEQVDAVPAPADGEVVVPAPAEGEQVDAARVLEPLAVVLVASGKATARIASALAPRLAEAGFLPAFTRCRDFSCAHAPRSSDGLRVIIVFSEHADALVIAVRDDALRAIVDEAPVSIPRTPLDDEVLSHTVLRALIDSPEHLRSDWMRVESVGRHRAPPAGVVEADEEAEPPPRPPAFRRGGYFELGIGTASSMLEGMPFGFAAGLGAGFLFTGRRTEQLVVALGVHATNVGRVGSGYFTPEARLGVGLSTSRVLGMAHVGVGPGVAYGAGDIEGIGPSTSFSASLRGRLGRVVALGVEAGMMMDFVRFTPIFYGLFGPTFTWDVPRRRSSSEMNRSAQTGRSGEEPRR